MARLDPSSSSNLNEVAVEKWHWKAAPDFTTKTLHCSIFLEIRTLSQGVQNLVRRSVECSNL